MRKHKKLFIILAIVLVVAIAAMVFFMRKGRQGQAADVRSTVAVAARGDISRVLEGSGTLEAIDQYEVTSIVSGDVLFDYFEEGDMVEKDDLLYQIDSAAVEKNISRAQNSLTSSQMSYDEAVTSANDLTVKSTASGVITELYVEEGQSIQNGANICKIIQNDHMILNITFLEQQAAYISAGQAATIEIVGDYTKLYGTVKSVSSGSIVNSMGVPVSTVEITVPNPGGIKTTDTATALVGDFACAAPGTFSYPKEAIVSSKASGTVRNLRVKSGDKVSDGGVLLSLENTSVTNQVSKGALSLSDARLSLENYYDDLEQYSLTAPISGKVIQKSIKAGDKIASAGGSTSMAVIADLSAFIFTMSVDELDISDLEVGQDVMIVADAIDDRAFSGKVNNISIIGTSQNGVTTYPVEILISDVEDTGLIPGMNVTATIVLEEKKNVVTVPVSAVMRGGFVMINGTEERVPVTTGINDGTNVEIISGLEEGDEVVVTEVVNNSSGNGMFGNMGGGMGGGTQIRVQEGGGAMPAGGGMPSGGGNMGGGMPSGGGNMGR